MAFFNYDQARVRGGKDWPYRFLAEEALADIDGRIATFAAFPDDETPITEMVTTDLYACQICHAHRSRSRSYSSSLMSRLPQRVADHPIPLGISKGAARSKAHGRSKTSPSPMKLDTQLSKVGRNVP